MLRISKLTDYATLILAHLAADPERRFTAAQIAPETGLAGPTVSKLLKQLHRQRPGAVHPGAARGLSAGPAGRRDHGRAYSGRAGRAGGPDRMRRVRRASAASSRPAWSGALGNA